MGRLRIRRGLAEPTLVLDSTPLIYLAKARLIGKLGSLPFRLMASKEVYLEVVVKGVERQVGEAGELRNAFDSQIVEVVEHRDDDIIRKLRRSGIHLGEASVISLAHRLKATVIIDDKRARHIAKTLGLKLSGTPHIIIQLVKHGVITKQEARRAVDKIVKEGWYCSAKNYSEIINAIEKI